MATLDPFRNAKAYRQCKLNGVLLPGKCIVTGASSKRKWDVVAGQGDDGASVKGGNEDISKFKLAVQMWKPEQFDDFERDIRPMLKKPPQGQKPKALEIDHPELAKLEIRRVVPEEISQLENATEDGLYQYVIDLIQYRPAKPASVLKAKGEDKPGGGQKPEKPKSAAQLQIEANNEKIKNLKSGKDKSTLF
jgi:hypothetical protein